MKYLDPSYHIRSVPANASDAVFCYLLAEHAVHAGMAGMTDMLVGFWNNFLHTFPLSLPLARGVWSIWMERFGRVF